MGGVTFATAAHGQGTGTAGKGLSSAEYTAQQGWVQSIKVNSSGGTFTIPTGDRLTITGAAMANVFNYSANCVVSGTANSAAVVFAVSATLNGNTSDVFQPFTVDSVSSVTCANGDPSNNSVDFFGYLTPISGD